MNFSKIGEWLVTDTGKKFCLYLAGTTSTVILGVTYLPHTLLLSRYRDIVRHYKNGVSVPVSGVLNERFQKALDLIEVPPIDRQLYKPFYYCGFDIMSAGSSYSKYGVIIGLPVNFSYENVEMIDRSKLKVNEGSVPWDSEDGQKLLNSLIMSENAQLYAMAREIKFRQTPKPILDIFNPAGCFLFLYCISNYVNTKFNFYAKPRPVRFGLYSIVGLFSFGLYAMFKDTSQIYYEQKIDAELKEKNKIFAEGGREYYGKLLDRNQAIRTLMGKDGDSLYSVLGNENYLFRSRHLPIVQRKSYFDEPLIV